MSGASKTVRNVLANELGVTKETVREMIEQRIDKLCGQLPIQQLVTRAVDQALTGAMRESRWDRMTLREAVMTAARRAVSDRVVMTLSLKDAAE